MIDLHTATSTLPALAQVTFTPAAKTSGPLPSDFADRQRARMDAALQEGDAAEYQSARRSLRSHYRYHAARYRDAAPFPITHDDHLANVAHQSSYHARGDVERMTVGLQEVSEWQPRALRAMDASAGGEAVTYDVPNFGTTSDYLTIAQRDQFSGDADRDDLASDFVLSSLAEAERLGCSVDDLDSGMRARTA